MGSRLTRGVYRVVAGLVRMFYPKPAIEGIENLPAGPCVIVGNHAQMNGPIVAELYLPGPRAIWCAGEMMHLKEVPDYAYRDFWSHKPATVRWFFRLISYIIAPLSVCVFNNARCIGVYHDLRMTGAFRDTLRRLNCGERIVIFPEHDAPHNHILCDFQEGFVDLARMYFRQMGRPLSFVPMYVAPALRKVILGKPFCCDLELCAEDQRRHVCREMMGQITAMACALPRHRVVPYLNIPRRDYPFNIGWEDIRK